MRSMKICTQCLQDKRLEDFHKRIASLDGLAYKCKKCVNENTDKWRRQHPNAHAIWYQENKAHKAAYFKTWRTKHADDEALRLANWARKNPHKVNAIIAKRVAAKLRAIPSWADYCAIQNIYREASRLRADTGERYEVDHIVPLQGKTVCGLHWEGNLQILKKAENISKHNRQWPGMP